MERIPVEVWQKILRLAIACPLLPAYEEYNHYHIQTMAKITCTLFTEYKQSERTRTNLRIVCSSWNKFLEQFSDRLVRLSPYAPGGYWPPVKRWDRVVRLEGWGGHVCGTCYPKSPPSRALENVKNEAVLIKDTYLPLLGTRCRAILYPGGWRSKLERLDHIELLNYNTVGARDPAVYLSALKKYTNLRHLQFKLPTLINPSAHIELPSLNTLSLSLVSDPRDSDVPTPVLPSHIGAWSLPKLHYLEFDSKRANSWNIEVLTLLLGQVGRTITHFYLGGILLSEPCTLLVDKIWDFSPSLGYLGIGIYDFLQMPGPPNDHRSPAVNVFVNALYTLWWTYVPPRELIMELPKRWASGRLGEVRLEITWEKFLDRIRDHGQEVQSNPSFFSSNFRIGDITIFDILHTTGKGLTDCDGVPFDNEIRGSILSVAFQVGLQ